MVCIPRDTFGDENYPNVAWRVVVVFEGENWPAHSIHRVVIYKTGGAHSTTQKDVSNECQRQNGGAIYFFSRIYARHRVELNVREI